MIYFAQLQSGSIKIGVTNNLEQRITSLTTYYRARPTVLCTMEGDIRTEREIHERFSHLRLGKTEQFKPGADLMEFIGRPLLVGQNPDAVEAVDPMLSDRKRKATVTLYLSPNTLEEIDEWLKDHPEIIGRSAAVEWAWRVASKKGAKP